MAQLGTAQDWKAFLFKKENLGKENARYPVPERVSGFK